VTVCAFVCEMSGRSVHGWGRGGVERTYFLGFKRVACLLAFHAEGILLLLPFCV
jgi:hypothetical protein